MSESLSDTYALPPRRETFLARYPRNFKLAVTALLFAGLVLPPAWIHGQLHRHDEVQATPARHQDVDSLNLPNIGAKVEADIKAIPLNDQDDRSIKLVPSPDIRVSEDTAEGSLPRISEDGLRPWQIYARPFNAADKRPRIAIVITGLGMSRAITDQVISQLPPTVTLSFDSQSPVVGAWDNRARQDGHEILLQVPVEPFDYPRSDPGPDTLLTNMPDSDNASRLLKILRRGTGYVGITTTYGSNFVTDSNKFAPLLKTLKDRGLMVLDGRTAPHSIVTEVARTAGVPVATVTQRLDRDLAPEAIAAALDDLEKIARQSGRAVGITTATPVMIAQLQAWTKTLPEHGIALAPLTSMVQ
jgi:polysaccharide deacetylase 2 family uncharacterized protein YibQ